MLVTWKLKILLLHEQDLMHIKSVVCIEWLPSVFWFCLWPKCVCAHVVIYLMAFRRCANFLVCDNFSPHFSYVHSQHLVCIFCKRTLSSLHPTPHNHLYKITIPSLLLRKAITIGPQILGGKMVNLQNWFLRDCKTQWHISPAFLFYSPRNKILPFWDLNL